MRYAKTINYYINKHTKIPKNTPDYWNYYLGASFVLNFGICFKIRENHREQNLKNEIRNEIRNESIKLK